MGLEFRKKLRYGLYENAGRLFRDVHESSEVFQIACQQVSTSGADCRKKDRDIFFGQIDRTCFVESARHDVDVAHQDLEFRDHFGELGFEIPSGFFDREARRHDIPMALSR